MSIGDTVAISLDKTVSNAVGSVLEDLDGWLLLVGIDVELDKQEQVTGQNTASKQGSRFGASAVSKARQVPAPGGETRVGCKSH